MIIFYRKISFWILILIIGILVVFFYKKHFTPITVKAVSVERQDLDVTVTATSTGIVKSNVEVNITAQRPGKIVNLYVEEGDEIEVDALIARLDTSEVEANLKKAEADIRQAETNLANIKREYRRKEALYKEELITRQQFDDVLTRLSLAEAALDRVKAAKDIAQLRYDYSLIRSPIKGVVTERPVNVGDATLPGTIITSVVDIDDLYITAPIDEVDVSSVAIGQPVKITIDAYLGKVFYGKVIKISPVVIGRRQEARTFEVRVSIPDKELILKPGMSADIEIVIGEAKNTLVVPSQAVIDKGKGKFVYAVEGGKAKQKDVVIGIYNWNFTEIKEGLKQGEKVIINPDKPDFKEGVRVKVVDLP